MDNTVKIWDVYNNRKCIRTYKGHTKPVRDICFSQDGRQFCSAGFDRVVRSLSLSLSLALSLARAF